MFKFQSQIFIQKLKSRNAQLRQGWLLVSFWQENYWTLVGYQQCTISNSLQNHGRDHQGINNLLQRICPYKSPSLHKSIVKKNEVGKNAVGLCKRPTSCRNRQTPSFTSVATNQRDLCNRPTHLRNRRNRPTHLCNGVSDKVQIIDWPRFLGSQIIRVFNYMEGSRCTVQFREIKSFRRL